MSPPYDQIFGGLWICSKDVLSLIALLDPISLFHFRNHPFVLIDTMIYQTFVCKRFNFTYLLIALSVLDICILPKSLSEV